LVVGVGIDIVDLEVFRARLSDGLVDELFLPAEIEYCRMQARSWEAFAARFAAKEALFKALGAGLAQGLRWKDVEVLREPSGEPQLKLNGTALSAAGERGAGRWLLSLTHSRTSAAAVVVLDSDPVQA
jgi:holo-[acyl-carrier protein] synthase